VSPLFIQLYLDENVDVRVAAVVRGRGFEVQTCGQAGKLGKSDDEQLAYAAAQGFVLVTHNRAHFEALASEYLEQGRSHAGIIVAVQRPYRDIA
jgi:predicted nuclease of predicted toxin-antitoxin system